MIKLGKIEIRERIKMLTDQQNAIIEYLSRISERAHIKPVTNLEIECAVQTMERERYNNFSGTLQQLSAYYELLNAKHAEALIA